MVLPASAISLDTALQRLAAGTSLRNYAQARLTDLTAAPVSSDWAFALMDSLRSFIAQLNVISAVAGIDAAATSQIPGYLGTLSVDIAATVSAAQACITWVVTNFPKDSTATWILSHQLNADGTRTPRTFASASTIGLQTAMQNLINTIS